LSGPGLFSSGSRPNVDPFLRSFFERPVDRVARDLLGAVLETTIGGEHCAVVVVEAEAYGGADDPASHAATRSGVTERNRAMFGPPGHAYVYRSYGVHWCFNVVTGREGEGSAVLVRGGLPLAGLEVMEARREGRTPLAAGPGRLAQALGLSIEHYGADLLAGPVRLLQGWSVGEHHVGVSPRIGITSAADRPLRFYVRGAPGVSGRPR
jgi:DNA-3-methyladenine glycosylase